MRSIPEAITALGTALQENRVEKHVQNAFDNLSSCLVLLNSSSPSVQMIQKLRSVLRQPLLPLYNACLQPALQLSCAVLSTILGKLCDARELEDESLPEAWDATAEVLLSGVLDFLDQKDVTVESGVVAWEALYRIICEFFFLGPGRGLPAFSIQLCLSAYNTLTEITARQISIQNALRQRAVLGGERLGAAISGTRDFLLLEALLMLFARLLPPTHNTPQGKLGRFKFVKEVVGSPKLFKCNSELLGTLKNTSGIHWDDIAAQIIDVLAKSDVTYPQPFSIDEIDICGRVFPQPLASDRLIMDRQGLLANIIFDTTNVCESLQVPYTHIRTITIDHSEMNVPKGKVLIMVYLTLPPLVANVAMESPGEGCLYAKFLLHNDVLGRFMEGLRRRGVGKLSFLNPPTRVERKHRSISIGSGFKFVNDSSPIPPTASFEGKVQHVNEVYKTDTEDPMTSHVVPASQGDNVTSSPVSCPKPTFKHEKTVQEVLDPAAVEDDPAVRRNTAPAEVTSKPSPTYASPFFPGNSTHLSGNDDELSEISEFESDDNTADERVATGLSTSRNSELKPSQHRSDRIQMDQHSHAASNKVNESSGPSPKPTAVTRMSLETGKPPPTSHSPMFGSSSTQVDVSPKLLSNVKNTLTMAGTDILEDQYPTSQNNGGADMRMTLYVDEFIPPDITPPAGETQMTSSPERNESGRHGKSFATFISANQKTRSRAEIAKDRYVPPKIAGSRRKREPVKPSGKHVVDADDACPPPRKKSRGHGIEGSIRSNGTSLSVAPARKEKRCTKPADRSPPGADPITVVELRELKTACRGTRRSSRIQKRQTAAIGGTGPNVTCGKTQKGGQTGDQLAAISLQSSGSWNTSSIPCSRRVGESPPKIISPIPSVEPGSFVTGTNTPLKASNTVICGSNQPSVVSAKEAGESIFQGTTSAMQLIEQFDDRTDEIHRRHPMSETHSMDKITQAWTVVEHPVSLKKSEDSVETCGLTMEPTPLAENVTIDLTTDESPVQERSNQHKTFIDPVRSEANISMGSPDASDCIAIEEPALVPSPHRRRRSVTFASPIEYVLERKAKSKTQVSSSSRRHPLPSENNTISPLRISTGAVGRESSSRITPTTSKTSRGNPCSYSIPTNLAHGHGETLAHDKTMDEIGDIVDVLNEIQAAIIKGISDKFRNINKCVQRDRDELVQQVLDELRVMAVENATYFNGLLRLEEDYHKNGKTITRYWEELIEFNDSITIQFQDALKEHVQNVSSRLFPKSLLPLQPVFPPRRT